MIPNKKQFVPTLHTIYAIIGCMYAVRNIRMSVSVFRERAMALVLTLFGMNCDDIVQGVWFVYGPRPRIYFVFVPGVQRDDTLALRLTLVYLRRIPNLELIAVRAVPDDTGRLPEQLMMHSLTHLQSWTDSQLLNTTLHLTPPVTRTGSAWTVMPVTDARISRWQRNGRKKTATTSSFTQGFLANGITEQTETVLHDLVLAHGVLRPHLMKGELLLNIDAIALWRNTAPQGIAPKIPVIVDQKTRNRDCTVKNDVLHQAALKLLLSTGLQMAALYGRTCGPTIDHPDDLVTACSATRITWTIRQYAPDVPLVLSIPKGAQIAVTDGWGHKLSA